MATLQDIQNQLNQAKQQAATIQQGISSLPTVNPNANYNLTPAYTADANAIKFTTPTNYTPAQTIPANYGAISQGVLSPYSPDALKMKQEADLAQQKADEQNKLIQARINDLQGITSYKSELENTAGISGQQDYINQLTDQLKQLSIQNQADQMQLESQTSALKQPGVVGGIVNAQSAELARQAADIQRPRAIQALTLSAQLDAAQGKLANAQSKITEAVNLKYKTITDEITQREKLLDDLSANATKKEQRILDVQKQYLDAQKAQVDQQKAQTNTVLTKILDAGAAGAPLIVTQKARELAIAGNVDQAVSLIAPYVKGSIEKVGGVFGGSTASNIGSKKLSSITQSIIDNPALFGSLTATVKGTVISELQSNGYDTTNLGAKSLSDTAIKEISQTQKALDELQSLKTKIAGKTDMLGPIKGLAAYNPYSSARQLQSDVDRVRQTVGKALEGGVLRKEDEDKYKKILATLTDTPETAIYKIDTLISSLQRDIETYKSLQQSSGRSANVNAPLEKKEAQQSKTTQNIILQGKTSSGVGFKVIQ